MTREEARNLLNNSRPKGNNAYSIMLNKALNMAIKALEQQPCGNAIDRAKAIMIASGYCHPANVAKELAKLPPVNPQPCEDAISRQAVLDLINADWKYEGLEPHVESLPPVTPQQSCEDIAKAFQLGMALGFAKKHDEMDKVMEEVKKAVIPQPKTGHWIKRDGYWECSECHAERAYGNEYCPDCGSHNGDIAKPYKEGEVEE